MNESHQWRAIQVLLTNSNHPAAFQNQWPWCIWASCLFDFAVRYCDNKGFIRLLSQRLWGFFCLLITVFPVDSVYHRAPQNQVVLTTHVAKTISFCTMRTVNKKLTKFVLEISSLASEVVFHNQKRVNNNNNNNNNNLYTGSSPHKESFSEA